MQANDKLVENIISCERRAMYRYYSVGWRYPGLSTETKSYLWKTTGVPSLTYGLDCISLSNANLKMLETTQGNLIKQSIGLSKRSRHSKLLKALDIPTISQMIIQDTLSLVHRINAVNCPTRQLFAFEMSVYILHGNRVTGTLLDRLVRYGYSPVVSAFDPDAVTVAGDAADRRSRPGLIRDSSVTGPDGIVDSLKHLLFSPNYEVHGSPEHELVQLLTRF